LTAPRRRRIRLKVAYRVARAIRRLLRREPPELGDALFPTCVHRFDPAEIEAEMREAGFRLARYEPEGRRPLGRGDRGTGAAHSCIHLSPASSSFVGFTASARGKRKSPGSIPRGPHPLAHYHHPP
jgi:hypothetical protein